MNESIIIGADIVPTNVNQKYFCTGDISNIVDQRVQKLLFCAKYRIYNLETVLYDDEDKIVKCGPNLKTSVEAINALKKLYPNLLSMANNHAMDYGEKGINSTQDILKKNGIPYVGAGKNIIEAKKEHYFNINNVKVGVYACVENEFSIATTSKSGCNPLDLLEISDEIRKIKANCDFLIVLYHGGNERYRYPAPYLQKISHKIADSGADLIVCQHSHCIGCEENYKNTKIIYGQGNFIFVSDKYECYKTSFLLKIDLSKKDNEVLAKYDYYPLCIEKSIVCLANEECAKNIMMDYFERSSKIKEEGYIQKKYDEYSLKMLDDVYYPRILGRISNNIFYKIINRICYKKISKLFYNTQDKLGVINVCECEAHRELMLNGLKKTIYK